MTQIRSLDQLVTDLKGQPSRRVAVAAGHDENTIQAAARAAAEDIADVTLVGDRGRIESLCRQFDLDAGVFTVVDEEDEARAGAEAVRLVRDGEADVLMKGLIGTDKYMRLILDKEKGLLPPKAVLSHVTVLDVPAYRQVHDKLLFVGDVAIIPEPDLPTKLKIVQYVTDAAHAFGIDEPKVALLAATEKVNPKMTACVDAAIITQMNRRGQLQGAVIDGPLALDVATSPEACEIKGLASPVEGAADCLVFPNIETGNVFYKGMTILGGAKLAAAVVGTTAPCVLTSRADSEESKFLSIAMGCRLAR
ncbi:phosphate butyryltransferase [bacterium]|nr:phosphate butyryltransferase [bacterium]